MPRVCRAWPSSTASSHRAKSSSSSLSGAAPPSASRLAFRKLSQLATLPPACEMAAQRRRAASTSMV